MFANRLFLLRGFGPELSPASTQFPGFSFRIRARLLPELAS